MSLAKRRAVAPRAGARIETLSATVRRIGAIESLLVRERGSKRRPCACACAERRGRSSCGSADRNTAQRCRRRCRSSVAPRAGARIETCRMRATMRIDAASLLVRERGSKRRWHRRHAGCDRGRSSCGSADRNTRLVGVASSIARSLLVRERGSKRRIAASVDAGCRRSLLVRERGSKPSIRAIASTGPQVAPRAGARIETLACTSVTPMQTASLLVRERGSKHTAASRAMRSRGVAPRAGARIETLELVTCRQRRRGRSSCGSADRNDQATLTVIGDDRSLLVRERGSKPAWLHVAEWHRRSLLVRERGSKHPVRQPSSARRSLLVRERGSKLSSRRWRASCRRSLLVRERGSKRCSAADASCASRVAPRAGARIETC